MSIKIINKITPRESITSAARNCYTQKFIYPEDTITWISKKNNTDKLIKDLLYSNHNTTFEHFYISFKITGYSRHFIWRYLHGINDYYSTDQQSQRYVKLSEINYYYPSFLSNNDKDKWEHYYNYTNSMYNELIEDINKIIKENFPKIKGFKSKKIAQELSRYVIPLGQTPHLTWTVNFITIIRYLAFFEKLQDNNNDNKFEIIEETQKFCKELKKILIDLPNNSGVKTFLSNNFKIIKKEFFDLKSDITKFSFYNQNLKTDIKLLEEKFDILEHKLLINENYSLIYKDLIEELISIEKTKINLNNFWNYDIKKEVINNIDVCKILNICDNSNIFNISNKEYNFYPLNKSFKSLINFTTIGKVSHSMDSQNQRHRTTIKLRPLIKSYFNDLDNKFYIPSFFKNYKNLEEKYLSILKECYLFFEEQSKIYGFNNVLYLLPNSQKVIIIDNDNMEYYTHKAMKRLCYTSQEEIWNYTYNQVIQLEKKGVNIQDLNLLPPCQVRKKEGIKPFCEEGDRYCGNKIWVKDFCKLERFF